MEFISNAFTTLWNSLEHLGVWAYWLILLIAFADSLFILGTFTGGTAFVLLAGVLVSHGVYDFGDMAIFAAVGAILGGMTSYYVGRFFKNHVVIRRHHERRKEHMSRAAKLLERFDGLGLLIGRFLGPLGSAMAFFAGFSGMKARHFLFWNTVTGVVWGAGYVLIGMLAGDSFELLHLF